MSKFRLFVEEALALIGLGLFITGVALAFVLIGG